MVFGKRKKRSNPALKRSKPNEEGILVVVPFRKPQKAVTSVEAINVQTVRNTLGSLLYPLSEQDFREQYYKKKAVAIQGGGKGRVNWLIQKHMFGLDVEALLHSSPSEEINVWMRTSDNQNTSIRTEPENALECHKCGCGLYFRAPQEMEEALLPQVSQDLGMNFSILRDDNSLRGEIETFISSKGHVTDWHFDFMENITIQLKGKKIWKLKGSGVKNPHRSCATHFEKEGSSLLEKQKCLVKLQQGDFNYDHVNDTNYEEVELSAGDVLYHPAGMWHSVETTSDSVSINLSFVNKSWGEILQETVSSIVLSNPSLLERVEAKYSTVASDEAMAADLRAQLSEKLNILTKSLLQVKAKNILPSPALLGAAGFKTHPLRMIEFVELDSRGLVTNIIPPTCTIETETLIIVDSVTVVKSPLALLIDNNNIDGWEVPSIVKKYSTIAKRNALSAEGVEFDEDDEEDDHHSHSHSHSHKEHHHSPESSCDEEEEEREEEEEFEESEDQELTKEQPNLSYTVLAHFSEEGEASLRIKLSLPSACQSLILQLMSLGSGQPLKINLSDPLSKSIVSLLLSLGYLSEES
eukprot:TRINITY_DN5305_c0_g1_i1.p1 TRINITY_DN5305_c0_g1~~TRINITY_DN5305_c0_g1_i1.p1  ORF type:complete len:600 (+),score=143.91 TRINITY_DN5305_c0_g1_i1:60-1802(+)